MIFGGDGEHGVLNIFVLVDLRLVQGFVEVRWVVILIGDSNTDEFGYCGGRRKREKKLN